jgi:saccharopine dehydrogenase-like NADP-dependent oxidoreductase
VSSNRTIRVIGGYGVFGSRLSRRLALVENLDVIVAGRSLERAEAFCLRNGGRPVMIDLDGEDLEAIFASLMPEVVIDAAGPFQQYGKSSRARALASESWR